MNSTQSVLLAYQIKPYNILSISKKHGNTSVNDRSPSSAPWKLYKAITAKLFSFFGAGGAFLGITGAVGNALPGFNGEIAPEMFFIFVQNELY